MLSHLVIMQDPTDPGVSPRQGPGRLLARKALVTLKADDLAWQPWPQSLSSAATSQAVAGVEY